MLKKLYIANWNLSKIIIFDKNRKFFLKLWTVLFQNLNVKFLYVIAYHSQINDTSKRINQIVEIIFKFYLHMLNNSRKWLKILKFIQRNFNNLFISTKKFSNKTCYDFISLKNTNLLYKIFIIIIIFIHIRIKIINNIIYF